MLTSYSVWVPQIVEEFLLTLIRNCVISLPTVDLCSASECMPFHLIARFLSSLLTLSTRAMATVRTQAESRNCSKDSESSANDSSSRPRTALTRVEKAKSGTGHCFFCDTSIAQDAPRAVWHLYHSAGSYCRNNGAVTGYTAGGWLDMYAHPQCCFHYRILEDRTSSSSSSSQVLPCSVCDTNVTDGRRVLTCTAKGGKRCRRSPNRPALVHCFACARRFLTTHRSLLQDMLSPAQRQVAVAWAPPKSVFDKRQDETWHLPRDAQERREYLALFDLSSSSSSSSHDSGDGGDVQHDDEFIQPKIDESTTSVKLQEHLQKQIREALETDRKRQRSERGGSTLPKNIVGKALPSKGM